MASDEAPSPPTPRPQPLWRRALRRRWLMVLTQWGILSVALMAAAYFGLEPRYESTAWLKVDNSLPPEFAQRGAIDDVRTAMETQVALITSPEVLGDAVRDPKVAGLARVRNWIDPETELRNILKVVIVPNTRLVQVSMSSKSPTEAATIVNAVVHSFLKVSGDWTDYETKLQIAQLRETRKKFQIQQDDRRHALDRLAVRMREANLAQKDLRVTSVEEFQRLKRELGDTELSRLKLTAQLKSLRDRESVKDREAKIEEMETEIETLDAVRMALTQKLASLDVRVQHEERDAIAIQYARADLDYVADMIRSVDRRLDQLEYEAGREPRIRLVAQAKPSPGPVRRTVPRRWAMVLIPLAVLPVVAGLAMWKESRAGRAERTAATPEPT